MIIAYYVENDSGRLVGGFTLEDAINVARDAQKSGRRAKRIIRGTEVVLEGDALQAYLS